MDLPNHGDRRKFNRSQIAFEMVPGFEIVNIAKSEGCALGCLRSVLWILLLAVDKSFLSNNDAMIRGVLGIRGCSS